MRAILYSLGRLSRPCGKLRRPQQAGWSASFGGSGGSGGPQGAVAIAQATDPAPVSGRVGGAYIQGMGWPTLAERVWHPQIGALMTHASSTCKITAASDAPAMSGAIRRAMQAMKPA